MAFKLLLPHDTQLLWTRCISILLENHQKTLLSSSKGIWSILFFTYYFFFLVHLSVQNTSRGHWKVINTHFWISQLVRSVMWPVLCCVYSHVCVSALRHIAFVKMSHYILGQEAGVPLGSFQPPTKQHFIDQLFLRLSSCFAHIFPFLWICPG